MNRNVKSYEHPKHNEWIQPVRKDYKMCCCDCGLVHNMDFRIYKGRVQIRARRNNRSTGQVRRWNRDYLGEISAQHKPIFEHMAQR